MNINLIAAIGKNFELGAGNALLWHLPKDMAHFRSSTKEKTVVMGRKTFESIGRPLPHRTNLVLSRDENFSHENVQLVSSVDEVLEYAKNNEIFVIGGEQIYSLFLPYATHLFLTRVDGIFPHADTFFPKFEEKDFQKISETFLEKDENNAFNATIEIWERKKILWREE